MSTTPYDDIIHLTRPISKKYPPMTLENRAAQFAPFAALNGFKEGREETARKTTQQKELDESEKDLINEKLLLLATQLDTTPEVTIEYFKPDTQKEGGSYCIKKGNVKKINFYRHCLEFTDKDQINIATISKITF